MQELKEEDYELLTLVLCIDLIAFGIIAIINLIEVLVR